MQNVLSSEKIIVRSVKNEKNEINAVASMQCLSYRRQFYDPNGPLQGVLGKEYPMLEKYETVEGFLSTWRKLAAMTTMPSPSGYAYVAFEPYRNDANEKRTRPVGIIKNMVWQAGEDLCEALRSRGETVNSEEVAELGSVYIAVDRQSCGLGAVLVACMARDALSRGYKRMVTRAYERNTSPRFFVAKTGGTAMGACSIPYSYDIDVLKAKKMCDVEMPNAIPGVWISWSLKAMEALARKDAERSSVRTNAQFLEASL